MVWCSWKIYKFLDYNKLSTIFGSHFHELQIQITRTLIAQAVVPLVFIMIPYSFLLFNLFVPVHFFSPEVTSFPVLMYSYIPLANALSILLLVAPYRTEGLRLLLNLFRRESEDSVIPSSFILH